MHKQKRITFSKKLIKGATKIIPLPPGLKLVIPPLKGILKNCSTLYTDISGIDDKKFHPRINLKDIFKEEFDNYLNFIAIRCAEWVIN